MKKLAIILILLMVVLTQPVLAKRVHSERHYQTMYANELNGEMEVTFSDRTRCDILTSTHAIEVDFADKYKEGVKQALHYANMSGKKPGLILIKEHASDERYINAARAYLEGTGVELTVKGSSSRPGITSITAVEPTIYGGNRGYVCSYPNSIDKTSIIWKKFKQSKYYDHAKQTSMEDCYKNWYWFKENFSHNNPDKYILKVPKRRVSPRTTGFYRENR